MTLYRPPELSKLPLGPMWLSMGRYNYGFEHYRDDHLWTLKVSRIVKRSDGWYKVHVATLRDPDEVDVIVKALPHLPGLPVRLHLMKLLLELRA